jgi:hypothetical protein
MRATRTSRSLPEPDRPARSPSASEANHPRWRSGSVRGDRAQGIVPFILCVTARDGERREMAEAEQQGSASFP